MRAVPIPGLPEERAAMAVQLLRLLALFGVIVAVSDYFTGNFVVASASAGIAVLAPAVLLLGRHPRLARLPLLFCHWLLFGMFLLGSLTQFAYRPEKSVWITLFPFAYFYLGGLRVGTILSVLSLLITVIAYFAAPWLQDQPVQLTPYAFSQSVGAFVLSAILAYLYERIRTRQAQSLQSQADRDTLTTLLNRRGFVPLAETVRQQSLRFGQAFAIVLLDVDNFKQINDRWGHGAGDRLLQQIATLLSQCTRKVDLLARWGGEEFIVLLPQTDPDSALAAAEKMRGLVAAQAFEHGPVTISLGVALHTQADSLESTINRADRAMYLAKEAGKNCVVSD